MTFLYVVELQFFAFLKRWFFHVKAVEAKAIRLKRVQK